MKKIEKTNELRVKDTEKLQEYLGNKEALHLNEKKLRLDFMSWLDFEKKYFNTKYGEEAFDVMISFEKSFVTWFNQILDAIEKDPNFIYYRLDILKKLRIELSHLSELLYGIIRYDFTRCFSCLSLKTVISYAHITFDKVLSIYKDFRDKSQLSILLKKENNKDKIGHLKQTQPNRNFSGWGQGFSIDLLIELLKLEFRSNLFERDKKR